ncbi:hypothetical protein GPX89_10770 [Nocardia sp. ET3-3]|uniref:Uncharacterized protein n=1 Tax=Nocardia terrae TaxID=2675851 RepID=A0A7K1UTN9_9NOCA|nr:hypothetical protein [Nocardia terrae]MVU77723.1 hypothetical protein [Nocardia terrae]
MLNPQSLKDYDEGPTDEWIESISNIFANGIAGDLADAVKAGELQDPEAEQAAYQLGDNGVDPGALHAIGKRMQLRIFAGDLRAQSRTTLYQGNRTLDSKR